MVVMSDLDSFYFKFKNLLHAEKDAVLTIKSEEGRAHVTLSVDLGHVLSAHPLHRPHHPRNRLSQQRRRARRAAARFETAAAEVVDPTKNDCHQATAEEATNKVSTVKVRNPNSVEKASIVITSEAETAVEASSNVICGKASEDVTIEVNDELCSDSEYLKKKNSAFEKTYCSVEIYPDDSVLKMEDFKETIKTYFENRPDAICEVLDCKIGKYRHNVRLKVSVVNFKRGWSYFFSNRRENYGDLKGVKSVMHACKNIGTCDKE